MNSFKLLPFVCVLLCAFIVCEPLPTYNTLRTCKHKKNTNKTDWKDCVGGKPHADYSLAHDGFADEIRGNTYIDGPMHVPAK